MTERDAGTLVHAPASRAPSGMGGGEPRSHKVPCGTPVGTPVPTARTGPDRLDGAADLSCGDGAAGTQRTGLSALLIRMGELSSGNPDGNPADSTARAGPDQPDEARDLSSRDGPRRYPRDGPAGTSNPRVGGSNPSGRTSI
jgi:hypothetical protein